MNTKAKVFAYAIAVLVTGIVIGFLMGSHFAHRSLADGLPPGEIAELIRSRLESRAGLTPGQIQKIDPVIRQTAGRVDAVHSDTMRQIGKIFREFHRDIIGPAELTDTQKAKLAEMERAHEARLTRAQPSPNPSSAP